MEAFENNAALWNRVVEAYEKYEKLQLCKEFLIEKSVFGKYAYKHGKKQPRVFSFDPELTTLTWHKQNSTRNIRSIPSSSITEVTVGNGEFVCSKLQINLKLDDPDLCFTIHSHSRNLHLVAPTVKLRDAWIEAIRAFILGGETGFDSELLSVRKEQEEQMQELQQLVEQLQASERQLVIRNNDLEDEHETLNAKVKELEALLYGKRAAEIEEGKELLWTKKIEEKQSLVDRLENQLRLLTVQSHSQDSSAAARITQLEEQVSTKSRRVNELEEEFEEFKRQMKQTFNKSLLQKVAQYRESKEALNTYTSFLKTRVQDLEKEIALWQAVVHVHVLPLFKSRNAQEEPTFKAVLNFALDFMEKKLGTQKAQTEFVDLLGNARRQLRT